MIRLCKEIMLRVLLVVIVSAMLVSTVSCNNAVDNGDDNANTLEDAFGELDQEDEDYDSKDDFEILEDDKTVGNFATLTASVPEGFVDFEKLYISDDEKATWYDALVKLISNQEKMCVDKERDFIDFLPPRPDEPSIPYSSSMGLYDLNFDGVPELVVNTGGGSSGASHLCMYDIFTGREIASLGGGGGTFGIYYDIENKCFKHVGRYDLRGGAYASSHYITEVVYDAEKDEYSQNNLFYAFYEYKDSRMRDDNSFGDGPMVEIADVDFKVNGEGEYCQIYYYLLSSFYEKNSLVPHTNLGLHYLGLNDVYNMDDSDLVRAQKITTVLLSDNEQKFIRFSSK